MEIEEILQSFQEGSAASEIEQMIRELVEDYIEKDVPSPDYREKTILKLKELSEKFAASLDAAYTNPLVVDWKLADEKTSFMWLIGLALVITSTEKDNRWLRYLYTEKIPKQLKNFNLRMFVRTCSYRYLPPQYFSDRSIMILLGSYKKQLEYQLIKLSYYQKPKQPQRKRGYTDGRGGLDLTTDSHLGDREFRRSIESEQIQEEIDSTREIMRKIEELLSKLDPEKDFLISK